MSEHLTVRLILQGEDADDLTTLARTVERLAVTDPASAIDALGRLEREVERRAGDVNATGGRDELTAFRRVVSSLSGSLREGHVRSLTGLERHVRLLTRVR